MRNLPGMAYRWCLRKGSLAFASHGALQLTGYSAEELVGNSSARELLPEADLKELSSQVGKAMQQHGTFTVVHRLKVKSGDFKWVWSQGSAVTDDADQVIAIEGFVLDISEQKRAEEELRLSEARFSKIFKIGPVAIGITTVEEGRFLDVNESFCQLMATTREEVIGKTALELDLWIDPTQRAAIIADLQRLQPVRNRECQVRARDGRKIHVLASVELLTLGNQPAMLFLANDITDRMNLEAQLRQSQKMEAIGQLAAGVAHDFNNIMTIIQGYTTLAVSRSSDVSQVEECLHQVSQASERAANLTRQLLTFSRKQLIQQKAVDLNEVVNNVTKLLSRLLGETVVLECSYGSGLPKILADEGMIEQVLMNLAVNARDAMPKGGTLQIQVRAVSPDELIRRGQSRARGVHVCLSVTDTGCGMDEKTMARIFEPFFTTKEVGKGTGLGLATVYAILEQHGGWVEVESQVEKGSTFSLYFPGQPQSIEREKKPQLPAVVPGGKETILVVEDEAALRLLVRKILERYGYRIIEAVSGQEALDLWQRHSKTIDLLLTDMVMPEGMSGRELAARLQQEKATLKVIYTSGYSIDMADESFCLEEGVNFLSKPYHPPTLARVVRNTLDQNSAFQTK
jgi:PAS domain S-box-containing protein